jgi:uncharacterized protein (TIGR03000 family)
MAARLSCWLTLGVVVAISATGEAIAAAPTGSSSGRGSSSGGSGLRIISGGPLRTNPVNALPNAGFPSGNLGNNPMLTGGRMGRGGRGSGNFGFLGLGGFGGLGGVPLDAPMMPPMIPARMGPPLVKLPTDPAAGSILFRVPEDALVWVNDELLPQVGARRQFQTEAIPGGGAELFAVRVRWTDSEGKVRTHTQNVAVHAGSQATVMIFGTSRESASKPE